MSARVRDPPRGPPSHLIRDPQLWDLRARVIPGLDMFALTHLPLLACATLAASMGAPPQVPIAVYYESLCPDSIKFLTTQLYTAYTSSVKPRMNLTLVPFGKSTYKHDGTEYTFECHHGPNECYGNKVRILDFLPGWTKEAGSSPGECFSYGQWRV